MSSLSIAVLMGGDSSERPVSFSSGRAVAEALTGLGFSIVCFDVSSLGDRGEIARADAMGRRPRHALFAVAWEHLVTALSTNGFDLIFPVLHGGRGEDGTLQTLLEIADLPFVGSAARACSIAIDKPLTKALLRDWNVPTPRGFFAASLESFEQRWQSRSWTGASVVKPAAGGSSVGVSMLEADPDPAVRGAALARALADGTGALIEERVTGAEVTCAVMGEGEDARALPVVEIVPEGQAAFYDFEAKYALGGSRHLVPSRLAAPVEARVSELALTVHRALGCRGVTRSDFLVEGESVCFLECNTTPGMTETSLVPDAARAQGLSFEALVHSLVMTALPQTALSRSSRTTSSL